MAPPLRVQLSNFESPRLSWLWPSEGWNPVTSKLAEHIWSLEMEMTNHMPLTGGFDVLAQSSNVGIAVRVLIREERS